MPADFDDAAKFTCTHFVWWWRPLLKRDELAAWSRRKLCI